MFVKNKLTLPSFTFNATTTTTTQPAPTSKRASGKQASSKQAGARGIPAHLTSNSYQTSETAKILIAKYGYELQQELKQGSNNIKRVFTLIHNALGSMQKTSETTGEKIDPRYFMLHQFSVLFQKSYIAEHFAASIINQQNAPHLPLAFHFGSFNTEELHQFLEVIVSQTQGLTQLAIDSPYASAKLKRSGGKITPYSIVALPKLDPQSPLQALMSKIAKGSFKVMKHMVPLSDNSTLVRAYSTPNKTTNSEEVSDTDQVNSLLFKEEEFVSRLIKDGAHSCLDIQTVIINGSAHSVSPLCNAGRLHDLLGTPFLSLQLRLKLACQLAHDMAIMHNKSQFAHYDLNCANLFVHVVNDTPTLQIGDFGSAEELFVKGDKPNYTARYPTYPAPEIKPGKMALVSADIDLWCLGVILFQLKNNIQNDIYHLGHQHLNTKEYHNCLANIKRICASSNDPIDRQIIDLLDQDPDMRPNAATVHTALVEHLILLEGISAQNLVD